MNKASHTLAPWWRKKETHRLWTGKEDLGEVSGRHVLLYALLNASWTLRGLLQVPPMNHSELLIIWPSNRRVHSKYSGILFLYTTHKRSAVELQVL